MDLNPTHCQYTHHLVCLWKYVKKKLNMKSKHCLPLHNISLKALEHFYNLCLNNYSKLKSDKNGNNQKVA